MPTYQFRCKEHPAHEAEAFWAITDYDIKATCPVCPDCGLFMQRVFTAPSVQFKGSGWGCKSS